MRGKKGGRRLLYMLRSFLVHCPPYQLACAPTHGRDGQVEF